MEKKKRTTKKKTTSASRSRVKGTIKRTLSKKTTKKEYEKEIEFSFFAPLSVAVSVVGSFNGWNPNTFQLRKSDDGQWFGKLPLKKGRYEYRFCVDGNWENDQTACELVDNGVGGTNCVINID